MDDSIFYKLEEIDGQQFTAIITPLPFGLSIRLTNTFDLEQLAIKKEKNRG